MFAQVYYALMDRWRMHRKSKQTLTFRHLNCIQFHRYYLANNGSRSKSIGNNYAIVKNRHQNQFAKNSKYQNRIPWIFKKWEHKKPIWNPFSIPINFWIDKLWSGQIYDFVTFEVIIHIDVFLFGSSELNKYWKWVNIQIFWRFHRSITNNSNESCIKIHAIR